MHCPNCKQQLNEYRGTLVVALENIPITRQITEFICYNCRERKPGEFWSWIRFVT